MRLWKSSAIVLIALSIPAMTGCSRPVDSSASAPGQPTQQELAQQAAARQVASATQAAAKQRVTAQQGQPK